MRLCVALLLSAAVFIPPAFPQNEAVPENDAPENGAADETPNNDTGDTNDNELDDEPAKQDDPNNSEPQNDEPKTFKNAVIIRFEGAITHLQEQYVFRKLEQAKGLNADLIILEIDSPGGLVEEGFNIAERLRDLDVHTVAYVPREALSAAAFVSLGCDEIIMRPQARLGDAGPIMFMIEESAFRHVPEKVVTDRALRITSLAETHGRPKVLAEAMLDKDLEVYDVVDENGERRFVSAEEWEASKDQWQKWSKVEESKKGRFLEMTGRRAKAVGLADALLDTRSDLETRYNLPHPPVVLRFTAVDTTVVILNHPVITGLLIIVGLAALFVELSAPGISVGGLICGLCAALFFWSRFLGGTSGWLEVTLFAAGVVFLLAEIFVIPGFGVSGVSGLLLMAVSVIMASQDFIIPDSQHQWRTLTSSFLVVVVSAGTVFGLVAISLRYGAKLPILGRMILQEPRIDDDEKKSGLAASTSSESEVQVGDWGLAESPLRPAGKAVFGDHYIDVVSDGTFVEKGTQVRIIEISGNRIVVRQVENEA
jgi:membrane-bound serine protease (ClpP class)